MQQIGFSVPDWTPPPPPTGETLVGRTARLEKLTLAHADALHRAFEAGGDALWTYMPRGRTDLEGYRAWVAEASHSVDPFFYTLIDRDTGQAVGVASYLRIAPAAGSIEVGFITFAPSVQRKTATTEAMFLMMQWAFEAGYRRYEWKCDSLNVPSRRAAQRLGLSYEGVFRQALVYKGRNRDTAWFAAIDAEWPALKAAFTTWLSPDNFSDGVQKTRLADLTAPIRVASDPTL
ncbi:GNAT family N-acetyltransferase [Falsirhodobacter halotolerans]|uniref:GNAT family N-acetyltransferase n=1 Tax=Falsirhodobacter halotolerans TaxID=1146892 RepID=UPI001FD4907B|nr:GNAT family protein [Falsirhodobacter halotolerans]MCJ8139841.1 GNAT family N-acetyltransferase [Falsirhodobacter halotolerans]